MRLDLGSHRSPKPISAVRFRGDVPNNAEVVEWYTQLAQTQPVVRPWRFESSLRYQTMPRASDTLQSFLNSAFWVRILVGVPNYGLAGGTLLRSAR